MTAESVAAASAAWVWVPDNATVVQTDEYTIVRMPDYFDYQLGHVGTDPAAGRLRRVRPGAAVPRPAVSAAGYGRSPVMRQMVGAWLSMAWAQRLPSGASTVPAIGRRIPPTNS